MLQIETMIIVVIITINHCEGPNFDIYVLFAAGPIVTFECQLISLLIMFLYIRLHVNICLR